MWPVRTSSRSPRLTSTFWAAAVPLGIAHVLGGARPVAAVAEHRVDRIEALARAALRALALQRNAEREDFARRREPAALGDRLRRDVVEGAQLVVRPPLAPVPHLQRQRPKRVLAHPASRALSPPPAAEAARR